MMKIEIQINESNISDHLNKGVLMQGARRIIVRNLSGYHNISLEIQEYNGEEWEPKGEIDTDGATLTKAIQNAMND